MLNRLLISLSLALATASALAGPAFETLREFAAPEANQAVAVDDRYFYAVDNQAIAKYDKRTGALVKRWQGPKAGPILHLDSAMVKDGKIYAAHSNYPEWPMTSSLEIFDADTLEHVGSHSFGVQWGSLTWVEWKDGFWWMGFANYDRLLGPNKTPYGYKANTLVVKLTPDFKAVESWTLPKSLLDRFEDMSNSGGSFGPDGFLYLSGHDPAEIYKVQPPKAGSVLEVLEVIPLNIRGQGIAWDRSQPGTIYGTLRATKKEIEAGGGHKISVSRLLDKP
ncbi:MAG: hypothetical protein ABW005_01355 [Burkholderiaceae bacterium]